MRLGMFNLQQTGVILISPSRLFGVAFFSFLVMYCLTPSATAVEVDGLYTAEVSVPNQGATERTDAIRRAFEAVLIKVTGNRNIAMLPELAEPLKEAGRYVEQFRYRESVTSPTTQARNDALDTPPAEPRLRLWVAFDPTAVNRLLRELALPAWGRTRPLVLVWFAVQDGARRYLFEAQLEPKLKKAASEQANSRGLPLVFPLMDLEDQANIALSDVWGNFSDSILQASARYRTDAILVGRVHRIGTNNWKGRWTLYQGNEVAHWDGAEQTLEAALRLGVDGGADTLASRFAHVLSDSVSEQLLLSLEDVDTFERYTEALDYLGSIGQVEKVQVAKVAKDNVLFRLGIRGTRQGLQQIIALGDRFVPVTERLAAETQSPSLATIEFERDGAVDHREADLAYRLLR